MTAPGSRVLSDSRGHASPLQRSSLSSNHIPWHPPSAGHRLGWCIHLPSHPCHVLRRRPWAMEVKHHIKGLLAGKGQSLIWNPGSRLLVQSSSYSLGAGKLHQGAAAPFFFLKLSFIGTQHAHSFTCCLPAAFSLHATAKLGDCNRDHRVCKPKVSRPSRTKLTDPCSTPLISPSLINRVHCKEQRL